jgi:hypothetical protein
VISGLLSASSREALAGQSVSEDELLKAFHAISSHDLMDYVVELTSKKYGGRLSGSPEYMRAAEWAAAKLKEWGLKPCGDNGTYFQMFDIPYTVIKNTGALSMQVIQKDGAGAATTYSFPGDYYPGMNSDSGTVSGEAIYVGYGISAPELNYDEYKGLDVKGKIVVVDPGLPYEKEDATFPKWVPYSFHQKKQEIAYDHGAAGMLYIGLVPNTNTMWQKGFVYGHISETMVDDLFAGTGKTYKELKSQVNTTLKPGSFRTGKKVTLTQETEYHPEGKAANIVAIVEGSDPVLKNEFIIVGGHFDAVGNNGIVMQGALDNTSGSVDIMGAAMALARSSIRVKRSVMFVLLGGEENGLVGSTYYTQHPIVPKEKTVCFFNLDMAGNGMGLSLGGGLTHPRISRYWEEANNRYLHRTLRMSESRPSAGRPRSDGVIFQRAGFRTLSVGTTDAIGKTYANDPRDTIETLTPEIMEDVAKWIYVSLVHMANADSLID